MAGTTVWGVKKDSNNRTNPLSLAPIAPGSGKKETAT